MIPGGSGVVSCDWTPSHVKSWILRLVLKQYITLEQYLSSLLFLLLSFIYYFRKYNGKHRNCLYTDDKPLPPPGAKTMVEVNLKRTSSSGEWEKGAAIKNNVIIVEKVGICPMCALLNIKLQQKRAKRKREKLLYSYKLLTSLI